MKDEAFRYEITEHIATLSENGNTAKQLNKVSYNGGAPKYDLRQWRNVDGEARMLKGITLSDEEARALKEALNARDDI